MAKNLLEILEENQIKVYPKGERWVALCMFHEEHTPSFTIYPDMSYYCFGCKMWGDAVKFLVDYRGMPEELALEYAGMESVRRKPVKRVIKVQNIMQSYAYLAEVAGIYHEFLLKTPGAVNYLHTRGLTDETISKYKIGFTDGGIIDPQTAYDYGLARDSGVISEDKDHNYWETLSHRITIPNLVSDKECDFIMGRTVTKSKVKYMGLRIPKPIYGLQEAARTSNVLFLVEGHFDWLLLKQWGYPAIALGGTSIPAYNLIPLKSRQVVIVPDNDDPGMKAAQSLHDKLPGSIILDYAQWGAKDVGELGVMEDGQTKFDYCVQRQGDWLLNLSQTTLEKWFPRLNPYQLSPST
jgi:DNA primase